MSLWVTRSLQSTRTLNNPPDSLVIFPGEFDIYGIGILLQVFYVLGTGNWNEVFAN
jgi:hypothetical protein